MPQPNSGRIGRSPGTVVRISWMERSMSAPPPIRAMVPSLATRVGKVHP